MAADAKCREEHRLSQPEAASTVRPIPRLPILGWGTFSGARKSTIPCLLDAPHLTFTTSGRASIYQALKVLGVCKGHSVLVPTYHCPTMVAPVVALKADPVFCPIDSTGRIDVGALSQLARPNTRAVVAPHYFGLPQPMSDLRAWCDRTGIALIEDCAHSLFGIAAERDVGRWGDLAIASLTKFLPLPEGGCLIYNRAQPEYAALQRHRFSEEIKAAVDMFEEGARHAALPGLNTILRMLFGAKRGLRSQPSQSSESQTTAAVLPADDPNHTIDFHLVDTQLAVACHWIVKHAALERIVTNRRRNYVRLAQALSGSRAYRPVQPELQDNCAPYVFPLWVERPDPAYRQMRARGLPVFRWDYLWPNTPSLLGDRGMEWSHHVIQLACHQDLREDELDRIVVDLRELCT